MVLTVIYFSLLFFFLSVQLYLWWIFPGLHGLTEKSNSSESDLDEGDLPTVSVLIPVCNEESNITSCLGSIIDQNYPSSQLQIVVINDHSTDRTVELSGKFAGVKIVHQVKNVRGKKAALTKGLQSATGQVILTLDGDCIVGPDWITSMLIEIKSDSQVLVTGPVWMVSERNGFLHKYQEMEQAALNLLTSSGLKSGILLSAIGANMCYYKNLFTEIDPYEGNHHIPSGDDVFFAHKVYRNGGEVRFANQQEAIAYTNSLNNYSDFIRQRLRWSAKSTDYIHWPTKLYLGSFAALNMSFFVLFIAGIWQPVYFSYLFYGIVAKFTIDYLIINTGMRWGGRAVCWQEVLKASLFQVGYVAWVFALVIFGKSLFGLQDRWKK